MNDFDLFDLAVACALIENQQSINEINEKLRDISEYRLWLKKARDFLYEIHKQLRNLDKNVEYNSLKSFVETLGLLSLLEGSEITDKSFENFEDKEFFTKVHETAYSLTSRYWENLNPELKEALRVLLSFSKYEVDLENAIKAIKEKKEDTEKIIKKAKKNRKIAMVLFVLSFGLFVFSVNLLISEVFNSFWTILLLVFSIIIGPIGLIIYFESNNTLNERKKKLQNLKVKYQPSLDLIEHTFNINSLNELQKLLNLLKQARSHYTNYNEEGLIICTKEYKRNYLQQ